jgi:hypothetical protein
MIHDNGNSSLRHWIYLDCAAAAGCQEVPSRLQAVCFMTTIVLSEECNLCLKK